MFNKINRSKLIRVITVSSLLFSYSSQADDNLSKELVERITVAKKTLETTQQSINKKATSLAEKIAHRQNDVKALREKAAVLQRIADEQLMSVAQLEKRVNQWSTQSNYQKQLLTSFAESSNLALDKLNQKNGEPVVDIKALAVMSEQLSAKLTPTWQEQQVISAAGAVEKVMSLTLGPVEVAYDTKALTGGPISRDIASEPRVVANIFSEQAIAELGSIQSSGAGLLTFDPTLGNAYKLLEKEEGVLGHIEKGGVWALPILFFGLLSFIVSIIKGVQLIGLPKIDMSLIDKIKSLINEYDASDDISHARLQENLSALVLSSKGAQQKLFDIAYKTPISQERDDLLVAYLMEYKHKVERFIGAIATSAAIAPLLGLLGTVSGMISTFMMMTIFGTGDASTVSGGISEALITTELGLIVAIPSLIISALLSRRTKSYTAKLETNAIKLSKIDFA
ncbi:MotA/TolQ/ExbB proton channel family protein [Colwellia sp. D2M02]|uniref:MotA/TolQ/ExbB proton channel family protein n=1 Tax=Colwellia sp. D2M02 TaxID=2841562 RepID=UPI002091A02B|nr:MotA/TolQ/ExbB proton channel family protein [Colwellia sp. D2M02]